MLMPKKNRMKIYEYVFKEGVCVAKKDVHLKSHPEIKGVPNLHVIKALQSLTSRGLVKEQFAWRHYYWYLTNEGIAYLREQLALPQEIVPATLKRATRPMDIRAGGPGAATPGRGARPGESDRDAYRKAPGDSDKVGEAGAGAAQMQYRSGFGRGAKPGGF